MKPLFITALLMFAALSINAQDLIVTVKGDSLNCKISRTDDKSIYFTESKNGIEQKVQKSKVKNYSYGYYKTTPSSFNITSGKPSYPQFSLSAYGGYSMRTNKIDDNLKPDERQRVKNLMKGYSINVNGVYFFKRSMGVGLSLNRHSATGSHQSVKDNLTMFYIAPSFNSRILFRNGKSGLLFDVSVGYLSYKQIVKEDYHNDVKLTGGTFGTGLSIGYDIGLSEALALSLKVSHISGVLTQFKVSLNGKKETVKFPDGQKEGLGHVNFSIGLRFHK